MSPATGNDVTPGRASSRPRSTHFIVEFHRWRKNRALLVVFALFAALGAVTPWIDGSFIGGIQMSPLGIVLLACAASVMAMLIAGTCAASNLTEQMREPLNGWLMSLPIRTRELLGVRYLLTAISIFTPITLFMASAAAANLLAGPSGLSGFQIIHASIFGILVIGIPNSLAGAAFIVFAATLTRRTEAVLIMTFVAIIVVGNWTGWIDPAVGVLLEPSGHFAFSEQARKVLRNASMTLADVAPSVNSVIAFNRGICMAVGACLLGLTASITRRGLRRAAAQQQARPENPPSPSPLFPGTSSNPRNRLQSPSRTPARIFQTLAICRLTLRLRFADPLFWLTLGMGLFFLWAAHFEGRAVAPPVPLFGSFGEQMFGAFALLHLFALILFALASRFDVEQRNLGEVSLTLPVDRAVWLGGWLLAMVIASAVFQAVGGLTNLALQAHYMPQAITLSGHLQADLLAWFEPLVLGAMALAVCCLIESKRKAALVVTTLWIVKLLIGSGGELLTLLSPGWMPSIWWSDFTGFELGLRHWGCYALYWLAVTCVLLIVAARAGKQGPSPVSVKRSVGAAWWPAGIPAVASIMLAFVIYFPSSRFGRASAHAIQARYERLYRHTSDEPQPRLAGIAGQVVIDTSHGVATGEFRYNLKNDTDAPIGQFNLDWTPVSGYAISAVGCDIDEETGFARCALSKPLVPGETQVLDVHVRYHHAFGTDESAIGYVTHAATLLKPSFFPLLGYDPMKEIQGARDRSLAGLRGFSLVDIDASTGIRLSVFHAQAPLKIDVHVRPIRGQTIISPRDKVAAVTELAIVAGPLAATKAVMADGVAITIYHHRLHTAMLPLIADVASSAIQYGVKNYGPLDIHAIRLVEADMRHTSGTCLSDTILLSEGIVFNSHAAAPWGHQEDVPSATVGHEIAHLWWAGQVVPARTPGFAVITESFAQYMSLMLRRHAGGKFAQDRMFEDATAQFKRYMKTDPDPAIVLSSMHDTDALAYGRGLVVMSVIERIIGEKPLNSVLRQFRESFDIHHHPGKFATLSDFRKLLDDALSREEKYLVDPLFDTNASLTTAQWKRLRNLHRQHVSRSRTKEAGDAHDP